MGRTRIIRRLYFAAASGIWLMGKNDLEQSGAAMASLVGSAGNPMNVRRSS